MSTIFRTKTQLVALHCMSTTQPVALHCMSTIFRANTQPVALYCMSTIFRTTTKPVALHCISITQSVALHCMSVTILSQLLIKLNTYVSVSNCTVSIVKKQIFIDIA